MPSSVLEPPALDQHLDGLGIRQGAGEDDLDDALTRENLRHMRHDSRWYSASNGVSTGERPLIRGQRNRATEGHLTGVSRPPAGAGGPSGRGRRRWTCP